MRYFLGFLLVFPGMAVASTPSPAWLALFQAGAPQGATIRLLTPVPDNCPRPLLQARQGTLQRPVVKLACGQATVYLRAAISWPVTVWQARTALPAGHVIQTVDLLAGHLPVENTPPDALTTAPVGKVLRIGLAPGQVLRQGVTASPQLIQAGAEVTLLWTGGGMQASMPGTALSNGQAGAWINARNSSSGKIVRGRVVSPETIQVGTD